MRRRLLWAVLPVAAAAVTVATPPAGALAGEPVCRHVDRSHDEVVFGHFATRAAAAGYKKRASALGFNGLEVENDGCGDFKVEMDGGVNDRVRSSVAAEAQKAGFPVTFQQTALPLQYRPDQVVGVVGVKQSIREANTLMWRLARSGFHYVDLVRSPTRWVVVMPQVPVRHALSIAHEVATAGFTVAFQPGVKP